MSEENESTKIYFQLIDYFIQIMAAIDELKKDLEEVQSLLEKTTRNRIKNVLQNEIEKIQEEIKKAENQSNNATSTETAQVQQTVKPRIPQTPTVSITSYAWDQSEKFMKIYATVKDVQSLSKENVQCEFKRRGFKLLVKELDKKNYELHINTLMEEILPEDSYFKIKTDTVLLMLKKKEQGKTWPYVTEREKKSKEEKKPKFDEKSDPNESLMSMLHQMYEDGDDEMKRTIAKSMYESRNKQAGGMGGL